MNVNVFISEPSRSSTLTPPTLNLGISKYRLRTSTSELKSMSPFSSACETSQLGNLLDTRVAPVAYLEKQIYVGRIVASRTVHDQVVAVVGLRQGAVHVHQPHNFQGRVEAEEHAAAVRVCHLVLLMKVADSQSSL